MLIKTKNRLINILHVDDEPSYLELIKIYLEKNDYPKIAVDSLKNPKYAFSFLRNKHYDLLLVDYIMRPLSGLQVLEQVRLSGNTIPFILLTGRSKGGEIEQMVSRYKNTQYLQKKVNMKQFTIQLAMKIIMLAEYKARSNIKQIELVNMGLKH